VDKVGLELNKFDRIKWRILAWWPLWVTITMLSLVAFMQHAQANIDEYRYKLILRDKLIPAYHARTKSWPTDISFADMEFELQDPKRMEYRVWQTHKRDRPRLEVTETTQETFKGRLVFDRIFGPYTLPIEIDLRRE
jgi:hypothetical protein